MKRRYDNGLLNTLASATAGLLIIALVHAHISAPYDNVCK